VHQVMAWLDFLGGALRTEPRETEPGDTGPCTPAWVIGLLRVTEPDRAHRRITPTIRPFKSTRRIGSLMMS
jgi:hypothetical protein